jgi:hypothetical protein
MPGTLCQRCRTCLVGGLCILVLDADDLRADVSAQIVQIERMERVQRLKAYEQAADRRAISEADRVQLIQAFAGHVRKLSPVYGQSSHPIDPKRWEQMLRFAHERDSGNQDVLYALTQLLIDQGKYAEARPVAEAYLKVNPGGHEPQAWSQWCTLKAADAQAEPERLTFPLHFCVLTRNPEAHARATRAQCEKEVEVLNDGFRTLDGKPLVAFTMKGFSAYNDIRGSSSALLGFGDSMAPYDSGKIVAAFNACDDAKVRDRNAINIFIFDSYGGANGYKDLTSHGTRNSNRPYMLIDWERLGGNVQNAEVHEMGHCFGLGHTGVPGAGMNTSTNIMASIGEKFGSGGKRDLGFSEAQTATIHYHAQRSSGRLGLNN